jgi:hypothetical protein
MPDIRELAPRARFELATLRLTAECSTVELPGSRYAGKNPAANPWKSSGSVSLRQDDRRCAFWALLRAVLLFVWRDRIDL